MDEEIKRYLAGQAAKVARLVLKTLTPEQRKAIAKKAFQARWGKKK